MPHGLTIKESSSGARSIAQASLAVIGLVATATAAAGAPSAALDAAFPLNTPVLVTDVYSAANQAGTGGTLKPSLDAIGDQASPLIVVVRVAEGQDVATTDANVIAGLKLLATAKSVVGVQPRILGVPGHDTLAVTAQLAVVAKRVRGFAYAHAIGDDDADLILYRGEFSARELMLIAGETTPLYAVARALGLRAQIDEQIGWHKTISNVPIAGVTALTKAVDFDLLDTSTEAGVLNDSEITVIIRENGYRFWGNRTCAGDDQPDFVFESAVRTNQALQDIIASTFQPFMDQPMTIALIKDNLETANAAFRDLTLKGFIMGAKASLAAGNTPEQLAAGRPTFQILFTPVAPLENPTVDLVITDFFYTGFADQLA